MWLLSYRILKKLAKEKFSLMTLEECVSVCNHIKEHEKNYAENKHVLDSIQDNLIINITTSDSNTH